MGEKNHVMWKKILNGGKIFKNIQKKNPTGNENDCLLING